MHYRRVYIEGGCYFFTVVTEKRRKIFSDEDNVKRLRAAFKSVMQKRPFVIDAAVVLPDHLHFIWTLPEHDSDYSTRWRLIKSAFTQQYPDKPIVQNANRKKKKQQELWQHRGWEHCLRDQRDFQQHIDYIHYNPVKHGLVKRPGDWQYSSIHRYIKLGMLDKYWGEGLMDFADDIGHE
ncbi:MAG: transposase [Methylococcaceae bacterium]